MTQLARYEPEFRAVIAAVRPIIEADMRERAEASKGAQTDD